MTMHQFDPAIADLVGVNAAVIYANVKFWTERNAASGKNYREGRHWTYNSRAAWADLFSYLTEKQVRTALGKLVEAGLLLVGRFSGAAFNRTNWYAPADAPVGQADGPEGPAHRPKRAEPVADKGQTITDTKQQIVNSGIISPKVKSGISRDWMPSTEDYEFAVKEGMSHEQIKSTAEQFRDHHAATGQRFACWRARWRTWIRNAISFARSRAPRRTDAAAGMAQGFAAAAHSHGRPGRGSDYPDFSGDSPVRSGMAG